MVRSEKMGKVFRTRRGDVEALVDVGVTINEKEFVVIRGASGSGKTTLLLALGGMLRPTSGTVTVNGTDVYAMSEGDRARFRGENIGFVFQMFHLVPYLNVVENVMLAGGVVNHPAGVDQARELLGRLGLSEREHHKPSELSAGEKQRTAIARALLNRPKVILADEPTGNLDPDNAAEVIGDLAKFHDEGGTVIVVTHGTVADQYADRVFHLQRGHVEEAARNS